MIENNWGAIFDWDGVVIDSSSYHEESWERLAEEEQRTLPPDHFKRGFGMKNAKIIPDILEWTQDPAEIERLDKRKEELYREIIKEKGIDPLPGVVEWLDTLQEAEVPCAIASSTARLNITLMLDLIGVEDYFDIIVSGEDVSRSKPDPAGFLMAADKIDTPSDRCVVFEDAHVGIEAARAAGMKVVGVASTHGAETLQDADRVVTRLDELTLDEVEAWF